MANTEQADAKGCRGHKSSKSYHKFIKTRKNKLERHRANRNPETQPTYGKYQGWES